MRPQAEIASAIPDDTASTEEVAQLLDRASAEGMRLWLEGGELRFRVPEGAVTKEKLAQLRQSRQQVMAYLQAASQSAHPRHKELVRRLNRAPVSFSQLQHWNFYRLAARPAMRHLASAIRLRGALNVALLRTGVEAVVCRHEALRTRLVPAKGVLVQEIDPPAGCPLRQVDLSLIPQARREREAQLIIEAMIHEPIDAAAGPLFETCLLRMSADHHVFLVVMEHLVSDMWSLDLVQREILTAYSQLVTAQPVTLPPVRVQFSDYASWQRRHESTWREAHGKYWTERLAGCMRLRFPADPAAESGNVSEAWGMVPISIGSVRAAELGTWCQAKGTTPALCAFTAYAVLVLRWCNVSDTVLRFETNGRTHGDVENTVGYFASPLYLRVRLLEEDTFADVLRRVIDEFCAATDHADSSYLEAESPRPAYSRNAAFNWVPERSEITGLRALARAAGLDYSMVPFASPLLREGGRDTEPFVLFGADALATLGHAAPDGNAGIVGGVYFPLSRFTESTMQRFAANFVRLIEQLTAGTDRKMTDIGMQ